MALPSQMARTSEMGRKAGGFSGSARGRRAKRLLAPAALFVAAAGVLGAWWVMRDRPASEPVADTSTRVREPAKTDHAPTGTSDPLVATFAALPNSTKPPAAGGTSAPPPVAPTNDAASNSVAAATNSAPMSVIEMGAKPVKPTTTGSGTVAATPASEPSTPMQSSPAHTQQPASSAPGEVIPAEGLAQEPMTGSPIVAAAMAEVDRLMAENRPVDARLVLSRAVNATGASEAELSALRARAASLTERLLFSATAAAGDPMTEVYAVGSGDSLVRIAANRKTMTDWRLIQRVNGISDPGKLRVGQKLKLVKGPFHAVVVKSAYRLDLYADVPDGSSAGSQRVYLMSYRVGLGENNSTPLGHFVVRPTSKLINPTWTNPRTGEFFAADNAKNPIGEHWIGLDPADEATKSHTQYGLHGTIEPDSIGQQKSMGCVRLAAGDIAVLYELLMDKVSTVRIVP